jgi:DNA-binding CsgD family transcriptional regulator
VSRSTVRTHVEHIREKLSCRTRAEAVARAMAMGLLEKR